MKLKISPLVIPVMVIAVLTGSYIRLMTTYACITAHELAHLITAVCLGLKGEEFTFSPFGAHLTLRSKFIDSFADELIFYAIGPLTNGILALFFIVINNEELYMINTALMLVNLLPVIPLDGGMILRRVLTQALGILTACRIMNAASAVLGALTLACAVYALISGMISYSLFVIAVFLIGNAFTGNELYDPYILKNIAVKAENGK